MDKIFTLATGKGILVQVSINFINWSIPFFLEIQRLYSGSPEHMVEQIEIDRLSKGTAGNGFLFKLLIKVTGVKIMDIT